MGSAVRCTNCGALDLAECDCWGKRGWEVFTKDNEVRRSPRGWPEVTKVTVDLSVIPEGWMPMAFRYPLEGEQFLADAGDRVGTAFSSWEGGPPRLILAKMPEKE